MVNQTNAVQKTESLKVCCDLEYILMGDLRQLLNERSTPQTRPSLLALLDRLLLNLPHVLRLSSVGGYMKVVIEKRPNWYRQIEELQQVNLDCISALGGLRDHIESELNIVDISSEMDCRLREWMKVFGGLRRQESQLLQDAFTMDIGGEA